MNRKQFIILLVLVAVLGAAGWIIRQRNAGSWQSGGQTIGQKLLPNFPVNDVAQITIKSGTNELNLAKRDNLWRVRERGDYPANFSQISEFLVKLADLKIVQTEEIGPSQLGRFELATNSGTQVEFKDQAGKSLGVLLLGKKHTKKSAANPQFGGAGDESFPDGRYVMAGGAKTVAVISDPLDSADPNPASWLNKDFFSIEKPSSIAVQFPEATNSWKLARASETNDWQLADAKPGEKLDDTKISSVTSPFSSASFNDVLPGNTAPEISGLTNTTALTIESFDGFNYSAKVGPERDGNFPMTISVSANLPAERTAAKNEKPEDKAKLDKEFADHLKTLADKLAKEKQLGNWIYEVPTYTVDSILKPRADLLESKTNTTSSATK